MPEQSIREVLTASGVSEEEIVAAEAEGTDELLAIDQVVLPEPLEYNIADLSAKTTLDVNQIRGYWRALGFADPAPDELAFSDVDVRILAAVEYVEDNLIDTAVTMQLARVLGLSMATFAAAVVEAGDVQPANISDSSGEYEDEPISNRDASALAVHAEELLPFLTDVMDYAFRRHLRAATRRRIALASVPGGEGQTVGFADMVQFTKLSRRLDVRGLAQLVTKFDKLTNEVVAANGGRIVKMIGDEAMFTVETPEQAANIALELADVFGHEDDLPGVRIGMASGPVLARDGDIYGPVVNLASRLVEVSRANSVVVSQSMRSQLAGNPKFKLRSIGTKRLRHIGSTRVYRLSTGAEWAAGDDSGDQEDSQDVEDDQSPPDGDL